MTEQATHIAGRPELDTKALEVFDTSPNYDKGRRMSHNQQYNICISDLFVRACVCVCIYVTLLFFPSSHKARVCLHINSYIRLHTYMLCSIQYPFLPFVSIFAPGSLSPPCLIISINLMTLPSTPQSNLYVKSHKSSVDASRRK